MKQDVEYLSQQLAQFRIADREAIRARFQAYLVAIMEDRALAKLPEPWADYRQAWEAFKRDGNLGDIREAA